MLTLAIPLIAFWGLFLISCVRVDYRAGLRNKPKVAWLMDLLGLAIQGWMIPLLQAFLLLPVYQYFLPSWEGRLEISGWAAFLLSFVFVDYLYYWNHRTLHNHHLWPWHRAHHSAKNMDIFVASRNSVWTHLLIIYVWVHSIALYSLKDDSAYLFGIALSSALDLWRHSGMPVRPSLSRFLGLFLILPRDHSWHHATASEGKNFGANFNLWDKLHGSWQSPPAEDFIVGDLEHELRYRDLVRAIRPSLAPEQMQNGAK